MGSQPGSQVGVTPRGSANASAPNPILSFLPMVVVCAILYFLVIRPQQRQAQDHRRLIDTLKNGDRVLTQGGIYGTVVGIRGSVLTVQIANGVRVEMERSAVSQVVKEGTVEATTGGVQ